MLALTFKELVVLRRMLAATREVDSSAWTQDERRQITTILCKLDEAPTLQA